VPPPAPGAVSPFDQILAPEKDPLAAPEAPAASVKPSPPPAESVEPPPPARSTLPRPEPRDIDVAARLADPLPSVQTDGTPLIDFLQVMSDLSTIPITLEPDGLPLVRANSTSPVALNLTNTTIGGALADGLARLGLEHVTTDNQLVVRLIEPDPMRSISYPIKNLVTSDEEAADLAELLQALVEPASWGEDESAGAVTAASKDTLAIRQRKSVHAQLFICSEKLRTARKLPYASSRFDPALFQLASRSQAAGPRLDALVSLNFSQPTLLVRILPRLEEAAKVRILVDWRDIASAGWNPDGEATLSVENEPLSAALTRLLEPMDLAWRVVDGQTLQIVTPATLAARIEIEFYKVEQLLAADPTGDSLLARCRAALGEELFEGPASGCALRIDAPGQCLLASLPQPKQQQLESLLARWRRELKRPAER
jgi:hypothetical protein